MTIREAGFRAVYHHFCVLPINDQIKAALAYFPGTDEANGVLTYGYCDTTAGLTLEVLAAAIIDKDRTLFAEPSKDTRSMLRIGSVLDQEFLFFDDEDGELAKRYADSLEMLHDYDASEEVEESRKMDFLDDSRHSEYIDDVLVYLMKDGLNPEGCWTRITGLGEHCIIGTLLNEPDQDFGYHKGEKIGFFLHTKDDNKSICYADLNPSATVTEEDLEDGSMLEAAVAKFSAERNEQNFIDILEILRDSYVWVPCIAGISEEDQEMIEKMVLNDDGSVADIAGKTFSTNDPIRFIPDILQNGEKFFFPIFSTAEAMGEYGDDFSKVQKHILEVIPLARNNEKELEGIVLNAFSVPFVLPKDMWDIVENMKSRIVKK